MSVSGNTRLKIVSRCQRTLWGEGHSAAGWGICVCVWLQTAGSKVRSFGQWATATCAAPPSIIASQYATSNCKHLRYINVETFNLLIVVLNSNGCIVVKFLSNFCISLQFPHMSSSTSFLSITGRSYLTVGEKCTLTTLTKSQWQLFVHL